MGADLPRNASVDVSLTMKGTYIKKAIEQQREEITKEYLLRLRVMCSSYVQLDHCEIDTAVYLDGVVQSHRETTFSDLDQNTEDNGR